MPRCVGVAQTVDHWSTPLIADEKDKPSGFVRHTRYSFKASYNVTTYVVIVCVCVDVEGLPTT